MVNPVRNKKIKGTRNKGDRFIFFIFSYAAILLKLHLISIIDGLVKSRHTRESGYPEAVQALEKTGFPFLRE